MNILFLSIARLDRIEDKGIYTDLLRRFRDHGHNVSVVYPRERRFNKTTEIKYENGITLLGVRTGNITKSNMVEKGIATLFLGYLFLHAIKKYMDSLTFDLVLYATPPITFEKVIHYIKNKYKAKTYLLLKDIFPQNAVDLQMFSQKSPMYWYFRNKEKRLYQASDYIGCMSPANVTFLLKHNPELSPEIIEVCPNSIDPVFLEYNEQMIAGIKKKYQIPLDKTVFIYGGNLGKPQGVDFVIQCLKANIRNDQVYFVIVGSGTELKKLEAFFNKEKPENARLLEQLPHDEYEVLVNSCDVGLIFLDKSFTIPNFPSWLLSYMQAAKPVLAATDVNTDIREVIRQGNFGCWCESNSVEEFNKKVQLLCDLELRTEMGINARKYLENYYTAEHSYNIIMKHFN